MDTLLRSTSRRAVARLALVASLLANSLPSAQAAGPYAYLPSSDHATVSQVDLNTLAAPATINVTGTAATTAFYGAALAGRGEWLYISDQANGQVFQIDTASGTTTHTYTVGASPRGIAVDPSGTHVYVANYGGKSMSIINTVTQGVTSVDFSTITLGEFASPEGVALDLAGTHAYVTENSFDHRVCRINLMTPPASVSNSDCVVVGDPMDSIEDPVAVAVTPDGAHVYATSHHEDIVTVVDTATMAVTRQIVLLDDVGNGITINATGTRAYVGGSVGKLFVLDLTRVPNLAQNPVIDVVTNAAIASINGVSMSPDGTRVLLADTTNSKMHVINVVGDADTLVASVSVNHAPIAIGQFTARDALFASGFE